MRPPHSEVNEQNELPGMMATLCSYENLFGPYHPQTLRLAVDVGVACWRLGEPRARPLLERAVRDLGRILGRGSEIRFQAMTALRDLLIEQHEYEGAGAVQRELLECRVQRLGEDHPETLATRAHLVAILLTAGNPPHREA
jgi:hypothetical protein